MVVWKEISVSPTVLAVAIAIFLPLALTGFLSSAQGSEEIWVDALFNFEFLDGANLSMELKLDVHKITVFDRVYSAEDIRDNYGETGAAFGLKLFEYVRDTLRDRVFSGCNVEIGIPYVDEASLSYSSSNPYNPPVTFYIDGNISLTGEFFDYQISSVDKFLNGILDMGGCVKYSFEFLSPPGWNISYNFGTPEYIEIREVEKGILSPEGNDVRWEMENWNGMEEKALDGYVVLREKQPTSDLQNDDLRLDINFDLRDIDVTHFRCTLQVNAVDVSHLLDLPDFVSDLDVIPSDGIRLFADLGIISWDDVYSNVIAPFKEDVEGKIKNLFGDVDITFNVNLSSTSNCSHPFNITHMDIHPPISANLSGELEKFVYNISTKMFLGFIYAGGSATLTDDDLGLLTIGYPFTAHVTLPEDLSQEVEWNDSTSLNSTLEYANAPLYEDERTARIIDMEIKSIDLDLIGLFTGKAEVINRFDAKDKYLIYRIKPYNGIKAPESISIDFLNADLIRLCIEEKLFSREVIDSLFNERMLLAEQAFSQTLGVPELKVYPDERGFDESLEWDGDIRNMDDAYPIVIPIYSSIPKKATFSFSLFPFSFKVHNMSFECRNIPGQSTKYRFVFPPGVKVECNDSSGIVSINTTSDNKVVVEVQFDGYEDIEGITISCSMDIPPLMVFTIFLPFLLIIFVIAILIVIVVTIKRKWGGRIKPVRAPPQYQEEYRPPLEEQR
ncbi:MAG TPA: hypothetical protein ENG74_02860 [Thermoplasmatales archaeon]|nr:hypothetical protein [Thermoplasmatales archaeon]